LAPEVELLLAGIDHGVALHHHLKVNVLAISLDLGHGAPEAVSIGLSELDG
jgi:hypothetical protein